MFDYHMHSRISFDSREDPWEMVQAALNAGLQEICFTDHVDDDPAGIILDQRFAAEEYASAYDELSVPGLKIRRGMEFGLLPDNQASLKHYLSLRRFDFVLGSIHYADGLDVYYQPYWEGKTIFDAERKYLEDTYTCVKAHDDFDVLGHLTYLSKARSHPTHGLIDLDTHREVVEEIMKVLIAKGKGMEINSSGVDRCGDFLPGEQYLRLFKCLGGEIVTIGSDAHDSSRVGQYSDRACALLKDVFGYVCTFEDRKPIFHKL